MHAPEFRDTRLASETMRRLDEFAAAEETGTESAALAAALIGELADLSPFKATALQRAVRDAYRHAPDRTPRQGSGLADSIDKLIVTTGFTAGLPGQSPPSRVGRWFRLAHANGHIREETLGAIDEPPPAPIFLAALLLCLNDHVPRVRAAARACFLRLHASVSSTIITAAVPYIVTRWFGVVDAGDRAAIRALLGRDDVKVSIRTLLMTSQTGWLPRFFRGLLASEVADGWLVALATGARHPAIRARSTLVLVQGRVDRLPEFRSLWRDPLRNRERPVNVSFDIGALIATGAKDRTVAVRKAAAEGLVRHHRSLPDVAQLMEAFGNEKNAVIRNRLDFIRRQLVAE